MPPPATHTPVSPDPIKVQSKLRRHAAAASMPPARGRRSTTATVAPSPAPTRPRDVATAEVGTPPTQPVKRVTPTRHRPGGAREPTCHRSRSLRLRLSTRGHTNAVSHPSKSKAGFDGTISSHFDATSLREARQRHFTTTHSADAAGAQSTQRKALVFAPTGRRGVATGRAQPADRRAERNPWNA